MINPFTSAPREELLDSLNAYAATLPMNQLLSLTQSAGEAAGAFVDKVEKCPHCGGTYFVKNGLRHGRQAYICRECGKTFVSTTGTVRYRSHQSRAVWQDAISDTLNGVSLQKTADRLNISKEVAFDIRHKIMSVAMFTESRQSFFCLMPFVWDIDVGARISQLKWARVSSR